MSYGGLDSPKQRILTWVTMNLRGHFAKNSSQFWELFSSNQSFAHVIDSSVPERCLSGAISGVKTLQGNPNPKPTDNAESREAKRPSVTAFSSQPPNLPVHRVPVYCKLRLIRFSHKSSSPQGGGAVYFFSFSPSCSFVFIFILIYIDAVCTASAHAQVQVRRDKQTLIRQLSRYYAEHLVLNIYV